ncbi:hypothetical protein ACF0H5_016069 [Mactra antiquata]
MLSSIMFVVFTTISTFSIFSTLFFFIPFISRLDYPQNDLDLSTYFLFTIDLTLVVLFLVQHSFCSSRFVKNIMNDWELTPISRSIYVMYTAIALGVMMYLWQPITEVSVWMIDLFDRTWLWLFFTILHISLWFLLFLQVLVMEPLHLIGIKQVYIYYLKQKSIDVVDMNPHMIRYLKHMPHVGAGCFIALLWLHPYMTLDRLILATVLTSYLCCYSSTTQKDYEYVQSCSCVYSVSSTTFKRSEIESNKKTR